MSDNIRDQAWQWHCALSRDDADWDGFTAWLEAASAHRAAYDEIALLDDTLGRHSERLGSILPVENSDELAVSHRRWGLWAGGAIAAAIALFVAIPMIGPHTPAPQSYQTAASQNREIMLDDGSHITLGPSSHLTIGGDREDQIALEGGAWFDIRHDPDRTLVISAGGRQITDIGTKFDIVAVPGHLHVAVAEGRVAVHAPNEDEQTVHLSAGRSLSIDTQADTARLGAVEARDIGSWRSGRLVYNNAPLSLVAADISRYVGQKVVVSREVAARRFSGVLAVEGGAKIVDELDELMDLETQVDGDHLRLVAGNP